MRDERVNQSVVTSDGGRRYRILVGTSEIAGQLLDFADGFRQLGHQVTSVIGYPNPFYLDLKYDVDLNPKITWPGRIARSESPVVRLPRGLVGHSYHHPARLGRLMRLIAQHDLFVFQWGGFSLTRGNREYPLLKKLGKRIISVFNGDDIRHASAYDQQYGVAGNYSGWEELCEFKSDPLVRPLKNLRMGERYGDLLLAVPNFAGLMLRPYMHFFVPIDLRKLDCYVPDREVPVVVHAPSSKGVKGTAAIMNALERLRSEGLRFELRLLHGVSNQEVIAALTEADVAIEQLHISLHGRFGVEAMATGCALATCNRTEYEPIPPNRPVWHIDPETVYEQLKQLLSDRELRVRLAREGRPYVEKYHDHVVVARRIIECLDANGLERYGHYPTFFACRYRLPDGVTIPSDLKHMTAQIVRRWGLPEEADPRDMIKRGLLPAGGLDLLEPIPRWKSALSPTADQAALMI